MSINEEILSALSTLGVPVSFQTYSGKAGTYLTFFTYLDKPVQHADDEEIATGHYVQLDLFSGGDYTTLAADIHSRMKTAGFQKIAFYDLYEKELKIYHKVMRFCKELA